MLLLGVLTVPYAVDAPPAEQISRIATVPTGG
jgi:hypothetical protein